ncbi:hypothetical protein GCM10009576_093270 [Streptomyces rhizosphaericus]|uniref:Uncharacterized protein n=2 Tax=Streptomyces rhizosphaericus TaxID=114699 RepID=A0ABP4C9A9_9ACTN
MPLAGGVWRVAPLQGEMTQSFLSRVAAGYGIGLRDLLAAIAEVGGLSNVTGQTRVDSEVYLNRAGSGSGVPAVPSPGGSFATGTACLGTGGASKAVHRRPSSAVSSHRGEGCALGGGMS